MTARGLIRSILNGNLARSIPDSPHPEAIQCFIYSAGLRQASCRLNMHAQSRCRKRLFGTDVYLHTAFQPILSMDRLMDSNRSHSQHDETRNIQIFLTATERTMRYYIRKIEVGIRLGSILMDVLLNVGLFVFAYLDSGLGNTRC